MRAVVVCGGRSSHGGPFLAGALAATTSWGSRSALCCRWPVDLGHELTVHGPSGFKRFGLLPRLGLQCGNPASQAIVVGFQFGASHLELVEPWEKGTFSGPVGVSAEIAGQAAPQDRNFICEPA